ncbi:MAG: T9SS type A sorting domain-containing protein [Lentimicrobium sp.]|nr:T9SS type A sorting domain-containing protein [Lentimicrobium sp.]
MKKLLLFTSALLISAGLSAQKSLAKAKHGFPVASQKLYSIDEARLVKTPANVAAPYRPYYKATADITVVSIGNAANAYGLYNGGRTALWADPNLNTIAFSHRMLPTPGSGYLAYDVSKDGGNTWLINNQIFNPTAGGTANARYPQGVIYNPAGNTNPDAAYMSVFAPTLDGSNTEPGSWGGYAGATVKFDGTGVSQIGWPSVPPIRQNVPDGMTLNPVTGDVFVIDHSMIGGLGNQYVDTLVITRGIFNSGTGAYDYEQSLLYAPVNAYGTAISDNKVAFAPDGMTGYILTLSDNGEDPFATESAFYPILYKTTDGGVTWDEDPIVVPLGGSEGLPGIIYGLMDDAQWLEFWGDPVPEREEIIFTTAFTSDFAVDFNGNPVINVVIGVSGIHSETPQAYSILSSGGFIASYNIFSQDGGETWIAQKLGTNLKTFRGHWGLPDPEGIDEDNRSQLTSTPDGTKMFFSWLDTDLGGVEDNVQPDIYCVGWDVVNNTYTDADDATEAIDAVNVTYLSDAWLQAYMSTAANQCFTSGTDYIIPFVYQALDETLNPDLPVQYKYIKDFKFNEADFIYTGMTNPPTGLAGVSQNYPNPFNGTTQIDVNLINPSSIRLEVFDLAGRLVYEIPAFFAGSGSHSLHLDASYFNPGIYIYSVTTNELISSRKMIVR